MSLFKSSYTWSYWILTLLYALNLSVSISLYKWGKWIITVLYAVLLLVSMSSYTCRILVHTDCTKCHTPVSFNVVIYKILLNILCRIWSTVFSPYALYTKWYCTLTVHYAVPLSVYMSFLHDVSWLGLSYMRYRCKSVCCHWHDFNGHSLSYKQCRSQS